MFPRLKAAAGRIAAGVVGVAGAGMAAAQTTTLDVTGATDYITAGVTAAGVIGVAFLGFKYVKRIWAKL
jgi:hypothetical protein